MIEVLVCKDTNGQLYQLRMDKPFERPLAKLITAVANESRQQGAPRELASIWVEEMTIEEYNNIEQVHTGGLPTFVQNDL